MFRSLLTSVDDVIARLKYPNRSTSNTYADEKRFERLLARYLRGRGHFAWFWGPEIAMVSKEEHEHEVQDPLARARRFLRAATGSDVLRPGTWKIDVRCLQPWIKQN